MGICNRPFSLYFTKRSPVWLAITVCFILFCFNIGVAFGLPNLAPTAYEYTFWTDAIIVSTTTGATTDTSPLTTNDNLYVSWAVKNKGDSATSNSFSTQLYIDNVLRDTRTAPPPVAVGQYQVLQNYSIGKLSQGTHTIKVIADSGNTIVESNEGDNQYIKTITVSAPLLPAQITIGPPSLSFGNVQVNTCSSASFAIQHVSGTNPASGSVSANPNPPFSITSNSSFSVSNGQGINVGVQFCPTSAGAFSGSATINSNAIMNISSVSLNGTGFIPQPTTGAIQVNARLDGSPWTGSVNYSISGPIFLNGTNVPADFQDKPQGTYTISYSSGGPTRSTLTNITPSSTQTLIGGGSITFTLNFSSLPTQPPTATTGVGTPNGPTTAMLDGYVNPNGTSTNAWFEWGETVNYGNSSTPVSIGAGTTVVQQFYQISNLIPGKTYHFRVVGENSGGRTNGMDAFFTMPGGATEPPTIKDCKVINPTTNFVTAECLVNPNGGPMEAWFEWGISTNYGNSTLPASYGGTGTNFITDDEFITGLSVGTRYYFKYIARNAAGESTSGNQTFIHGGSNVYGFETPAGVAGDPVNVATGSYTYQRKDLSIPGKGMPFVFERTYNSQDNQTGPLGFGWNHSMNTYLITILDNTYAIIRWGDGRTEAYTSNGSGGFTAPNGVFDTLVLNGDGTYTLRKKDQTSYNFNLSNKLSSIVDKNGNTISLVYTGPNLTQVIDTAGRNINFTNDGDNRITQITDPIGRTLKFTYDSNGNLYSVKGLNSNTTHYTYDTNHQILAVVDPRLNTVVTTVYDSLRRVSYQFDAKNVKTTYTYDETNHKTTVASDATGLNITTKYYYDGQLRLIQETDGTGYSAYYTYDTAGNRTEVKDKNGNITKYTYDSKGNVLTKTDALNNVTTITYDSNNNPLTRTDALLKTTTFEYDTNGNLIKTTDALNHITAITYDTHGQPITITDPRGKTTTNTYDDQGNLIQVEDALGNKTMYTYDGVGRKLTVKDARNHTTIYTYDDNNNLLIITDPLSHVTTYTYDANNNKLTFTDPRGNTTNYAYDVKDLLSTTTDAFSKTITNGYDALDRKISVTDRRGNKTAYVYNEVGNLIQLITPNSEVTTYTYDGNGNKLTEINPLGQTVTYTYDALNRVISVSDPLSHTTTTTYDALGRIIETVNAKGQSTQIEYDAMGRLTKVIDANVKTVEYTYDENGNRLTMTDPNGNTTSYTYDDLNRLIRKVEPLGNTYQYAYDAAGNRISLTDPNGSTINYSYDANNRLISITYPNTSTVTFTYDENGNRTLMVDSLGTSHFAYDALNRMISYQDPFGKIVGYGYDENGNRTTLTYPGEKVVAYTFDALNRLTRVTDWIMNSTFYDYNAAGNLASVLNPNVTRTTYSYDAASRLVGLSNLRSNSAVISSYSYTLDPIGNHLGVVQDEPLAPILANKNVNYTYDKENQLTNAGGGTFTYDSNGNMTVKGTDTFTYDYEDRLIQSNINGTITQYSYDGVGNRLVRTEGGVTKRYVLDVNRNLTNVIAETDGSGTITAYYVYGLGLISKILPDGTAYNYHYDSRGSTIALTDESQIVTDTYAYDSFGRVMNSNGSSINPFRYVGKYGVMEERNDLKYIRARYYSSELGRFVSKDPQTGNDKHGQSLNRYVYALNNPVLLVDFSGYSAQEGTHKEDNSGSSDFLHAGLVDRATRIKLARLSYVMALSNAAAAKQGEVFYWEALVNTLEGIQGALGAVEGLFIEGPIGALEGLGGMTSTLLKSLGYEKASKIVGTASDLYGLITGIADLPEQLQSLGNLGRNYYLIPKDIESVSKYTVDLKNVGLLMRNVRGISENLKSLYETWF